MNIDTLKGMLGNAERIKALFDRRDELLEELGTVETEIEELSGVSINGTPKRAAQKCSTCGKEGHSKRTCPQKGSS